MKFKKIYVILFILAASMLIFYSYLTTDNNYISDNNINEDISYNGWTYDKNEYPLDSYSLSQIPTSHRSSYEIRQFFEDSDFNNDGILTKKEISAMDYKLKNSQYTYNGPYSYN